MKEREEMVPERLTGSLHVVVRRYHKDQATNAINPIPLDNIQLFPRQAVLFGSSYYEPITLSAESTASLQEDLGKRQAIDIIKGRFKGLAMVDDNGKLTMEVEGGEQKTAELNEDNKTGTVRLESWDILLIGVIGRNPKDIDEELNTVFSQDSNQT